MRGIKVRGVFDTRGAAEARAKKLSTMDSNFHVFIGQVGYWLPWDPCADNIGDEVFQNSQLNDMMEKYQENNVNKDIFYEEQKRDKVKAAREEVLKKKREEEEQKKLESVEEDDTKAKVSEGDKEVVEEPVAEEPVAEEVKEIHKIENVDPWLANKLQQKEGVEAGAEPEAEPENC
jgi:cytochrome c1